MSLIPTSTQFTETDRELLSQLLRNPVLEHAVNIAIFEAQPRASPTAKLSPEAQAALANQIAGMSDLLRRLKSLATPTSELTPRPNIPDGGEWGHIEETQPQSK